MKKEQLVLQHYLDAMKRIKEERHQVSVECGMKEALMFDDVLIQTQQEFAPIRALHGTSDARPGHPWTK